MEEKKVVLFTLFDNIKPRKEDRPGTMCSLATQFDKFLVGDKTKREKFELILRINSRGGSVEEAISLYSYLRNSVPNLITAGYGFIDSTAMYVFLAGKERICTPETRFFVHGGTNSCSDVPAAEFQTVSRGVISQNNLLADIIVQHTNVSIRTIKRWMKHGRSFYAEEALEYGFIHEISTDPIYERAGCDYVYLPEQW